MVGVVRQVHWSHNDSERPLGSCASDYLFFLSFPTWPVVPQCTQMSLVFRPLRRNQPWACICQNTGWVWSDAAWARSGQQISSHEAVWWCWASRFRRLACPRPSKIAALRLSTSGIACSNTLCGTSRRRKSSRKAVSHWFPCESWLSCHSGLRHLQAKMCVLLRHFLSRRCTICASCSCWYRNVASQWPAHLR